MNFKAWFLPANITLLALISVLTIKSVAPELATQQALFFLLSIPLFWLVSQVKIIQLQKMAWWLYSLLIVSLLISLIYGLSTGQTGRWIPLFGKFNIQPSQLAIPLTTLALLKLKLKLNHWSDLLKALSVIALPASLILIEPDLGTTLIYLLSTGAYILMSDISWQKILMLSSVGLAGAIFAWFFLLQPYQKQRLTSFIDSEADTQGASYNARQSLIAAGSGQLFGRGLGQGVQSHLRFLPERQTDFIFASFAEEFGFAGTLVILCLYLGLIGFVLIIGYRAQDQVAFKYCLAIGVMLAIQAGVNIGMNIGLLPITGLTLPLLSYGGSSVLSLVTMLGLVQSIARQTQPKPHLHLS